MSLINVLIYLLLNFCIVYKYSMTKLTTHVLDVYSGKPGKGIKVDLFFLMVRIKKKLIH